MLLNTYGKSENFLSSWLKVEDTEDISVGSKWGYTYTADWKVQAEKHEVKEHSIIVLNRQWRLSEKKLKPALKLYQVHSATFESGILSNTEVLDRLGEIQDTGMLIGLSLSGPQQAETLRQAMKVSVEGRLLFDSVQITSNLLEHHSDRMIEEAADRGMGIIVKEGLANGRLTERNVDPNIEKHIDILKAIAKNYGVGIDSIALAYILSKSYNPVVLSGAATEGQLESNIKAAEIQLTNSEIHVLNKLQLGVQDYWYQRNQLVWN
ncbi:MAG: aldo/keto reductase [Bacteroidota bacterium]